MIRKTIDQYSYRLYKIITHSSLLSIILLGATNSILLAQTAQPQAKDSLYSTKVSPDTAAVADTVVSTENKHIWILGATVGNNSSYLGRYQATRLPYYATDITYRNKSGLWLSSTVYQVFNTSTFIDEIDLMAGWNLDLSKKVDASVYYSRFFISPESELIKASVGNALNASAGLDWGYAYTRLNGSLLLGEHSDFFLVLDNSRYFEIEKVLHKKDYLSIEPRFTLIAGTQTFVETHLVNNPAPISAPTKPSVGGGGPGTGGGGPGAGPTEGTEKETATSSFKLMTYELSLPVSYTYNKTSLELTGRYIIPVNLLEGDLSTPQLFLTASLFYAIY